MNDLLLHLAPFLGAASQEILYWYGLRMKLSSEKYQIILQSRMYWAIVILFILFTGSVSYIWFHGTSQDPKTLFIFGASLPALIKQAISMQRRKNHLGSSGIIDDYFLAS